MAERATGGWPGPPGVITLPSCGASRRDERSKRSVQFRQRGRDHDRRGNDERLSGRVERRLRRGRRRGRAARDWWKCQQLSGGDAHWWSVPRRGLHRRLLGRRDLSDLLHGGEELPGQARGMSGWVRVPRRLQRRSELSKFRAHVSERSILRHQLHRCRRVHGRYVHLQKRTVLDQLQLVRRL